MLLSAVGAALAVLGDHEVGDRECPRSGAVPDVGRAEHYLRAALQVASPDRGGTWYRR